MKNSKENNPSRNMGEENSPNNNVDALQIRLEAFEREKYILLTLSNEITKVRQKEDLIRIFSLGLKGFFHFTHAVVSLIDKNEKIYYPFLIDTKSIPIKHSSELPSLLKTKYVLTDPFIGQLGNSERPISFLLEDIVAHPETPGFIKVNYDCGIRKAMISRLKTKMETFGYIFIYSDRTDSFSDEFKNIIEGITPHLSNAVSNIIINEDIKQREWVNKVLLSLSNDMVTVRNRGDLLNVINFGLKKLIYFTNSVMTYLDETGTTYRAFLTDPDSKAVKFPEYSNSITIANSIEDDIYNVAMLSNEPLIFDMRSYDLDKAPLWFKLNFAAGAREMLINILPSGQNSGHGIILFSDKLNNFDNQAKSIIGRISSQLSTAANNIVANEEILRKEKDKSILLGFSRDIVSSRTKKDLSLAIRNSLDEIAKIRAFLIRIINPDGQTMSPFMYDQDVYYFGSLPITKLLATKIPMDTGITAKVMAGNSPVHINMDEEVKQGNKGPYIDFWKSLGDKKEDFRNLIGTPLRLGNKSLGILWIVTSEINMAILEGICAQISVAISNIQSNQEIENREKEKTILLSISDEIAALRKTEDLLRVVNKQLKTLFSIEEFGFLQINDDGTYNEFMLELSDTTKGQLDYFQGHSLKYSTSDPVFNRIVNSENPVILLVDELFVKPGMPIYVGFWKKLGYSKVLGAALRVGGKNIGCAFFYIDKVEAGKLKLNLLKSVCAQISVAISNIKANEEIVRREEEKTKLLSLSHELAALRSRTDLLEVVNSRLKVLFSIQEFGIAQIDEDGTTYSAFVIDVGEDLRENSKFKEITLAKYKITDIVFSRIMQSEDPVLFDVNSLAQISGVPKYVHLWRTSGVYRVLGMALRVGGKSIGCAFLHLGANETGKAKSILLKSVCAQLSVAVSNILSNEKILAYKRLLEVENVHLKEEIKTIYNFTDIIGSGPKMKRVYELMSLVAESDSTILLLGETGTGKELIARAIHNSSRRKDKFMIKVNCAAMPSNLIESELFGHEKGAFTGATERRIGKFELANKGTIFLDEIGEMPIESQVKLLRVIQERELERVGGSTTIKVDVRIIAATNRNLEEEVKKGNFRPDLFYRLDVFPIVLPPLRERPEDIEDLANYFLSRYSKSTGRNVTSISTNALKDLKFYSWPGNVRELEHLIERSILMTKGSVLNEIMLPINSKEEVREFLGSFNKTLEELERVYIIETLKRCNGKIAGSGSASEILALPPTTLHSKLKKLRISKEEYFLK